MMKVRELIQLLKQNDWTEARTSGGHRIFKHREKGGILVVSVHSGDVPRGTLRAILRQAGLEESE